MARQMAADGARLGLFARRLDRLEAVASEIAATGRERPLLAVCDVSDREGTLRAMGEMIARLGVPDIMVANAGVGFPMKAKRFDASRAEEMYKTNVIGTLSCAEAVLPGMIQRGSGHIVGLSSLAAFRSWPRSHTYCATKAAIASHLEGLRMELRPLGIAVTTIFPGFVRTEMTGQNEFPMPMLMELRPAVSRMVRAIARRQATLIFPRRLYWLIRFTRLVPEWILARVVGV